MLHVHKDNQNFIPCTLSNHFPANGQLLLIQEMSAIPQALKNTHA